MTSERPLDSKPKAIGSKTPWVVLVMSLCVLAVVVAVGVVPKLRMRAARAAAQEAAALPRAVHVARARLKDGPSAVTLPGSVVALETAEIYSRTDGFVREYRADIGDRVKAGDILAILDTPEVESQAKSAIATARAFEQNEQLSRTRAERYRRLADAGVNSREQADQYEVQANSATSALDTSRAEVNRMNTLLGFRIVKAPFDGVVTKRNVDKGTLVTAGSSAGVASLFEVARIEQLRVLIDVPQTLASSIDVGDPARVVSGQTSVKGVVQRTAGALNPATRTLRTEVVIPGDQGILAGSFVRVVLDLAMKEPPVIVPANALVPQAEGTFVLAVGPDGKVMGLPVELGRELGVEVEIVSGLTGTETVVKSPPESLKAGELVRVIAEAPGAKP